LPERPRWWRSGRGRLVAWWRRGLGGMRAWSRAGRGSIGAWSRRGRGRPAAGSRAGTGPGRRRRLGSRRLADRGLPPRRGRMGRRRGRSSAVGSRRSFGLARSGVSRLEGAGEVLHGNVVRPRTPRARQHGVGFLPATDPPASPCLVFRSVLARIGVLLGIEGPVRPGRGAVPRGATPVGLEGFGVRTVIRGRPERRFVRRAFRARRPVRSGRTFPGCRRSTAPGCRPTRPSTPRPPPVGPIGRFCPLAVGVPGAARRRRSRGSWSTAAGLGSRDRVVGRLDRQEPRQRRLTRGVGVIGLGQASIGPADLFERRVARQAEGSVRIGVGGHGKTLRRLGRMRGLRTSGRAAPGAPLAQPISSPTGASWNSAIDSAPTRPWGSRMVGLW